MEERRAVADATFAELVDAVRSSLQDASGSRASGLPSPAVPSIASPLARPAPFAGEAERCSGFLLQVSLYMEIQASQFPTERAKVAFVISLLADRALSWAEALWNIRHPRLNELATFLEYIKEVFSQTTSCRSVHEQLLQITQSNLSVQEYAIKFRTLAALSNWNSAALVPVFRRGLSPPIQTQMAIFEDSADLETFINRAIRIAQHLPQHTAPSSLSPSPSADFALPAPEPMITDAYRLNRTERARRITQHLCLYCGAPDHQLTRCPVRPPRPAVSTLHTTPKMTHIPYLTGTISYGSLSVPVKILLDSGASGNFISSYRLAALSISPQRQSPTYHITNIQGKPLGRGLVQFCTPELELKIGVLHSERLSLLVLEEANVDIVLGRPWLVYHQPVIDWEYGEPKRWGILKALNTKQPPNTPQNTGRSRTCSVKQRCEFHTTEVHFLGYFISSAGVRMDQRKVEAVLSWPQPDTIKQLQRFLGFANFYRRFIQGYSLLAAPLTSLLRGKPKKLCWTTEATNAFLAMKEAFCSAPLLRHPNPKSRFVVEVDAATLGVGAVLSQWHGNPPVLHPCAYFSRKLSPAEQNYDVGNRELLAIKLALEEWRHWLEGANHPFEVITDHKNLQYLREAKRLNPRQARWALFFTRFNFTLTYRPGHRNVKADALSRIHSPDPVQDQPEPILPPAVFVAPIQWDLEAQIEDANRQHPAPPGGPEGRLFVPAELRVPLLDWIHTSPGSGHPGSNRTLSLVRQRYWWPQLRQEVARYVQGCSVCATSSTPRKLPEGKNATSGLRRRQNINNA
ncbi:hypothetical protein M9458_054016 [Cirrhinus mrigala]|uniref:Gypsy retrotransposon integrase-like protein 1 n=1 Tax=Cirrhinus mrigala TaxID=683832 RepID=A0ABD0MNQ0_CIRMR